MFVVTPPEKLNTGTGDILYERLMQDLRALKAETAWVREPEQPLELVDFFEQRGFDRRRQIVKLRISLTEGATDRYPDGVFAGVGVDVRSVAELRHREDFLSEFHDLFNSTMVDEPREEAFQPVTMDQLLRGMDGGWVLHEASFVASSGEDYVGFTGVRASDSDVMHLICTQVGVRASYRRRGIATALLARAIAWGQQRGSQTMTLFTDSRNKGMLKVSERLGFQRAIGMVVGEKFLKGSPGS